MINVPRLYGSGAFQDETVINLDIVLSAWDEKKYYDAIEHPNEACRLFGLIDPSP